MPAISWYFQGGLKSASGIRSEKLGGASRSRCEPAICSHGQSTGAASFVCADRQRPGVLRGWQRETSELEKICQDARWVSAFYLCQNYYNLSALTFFYLQVKSLLNFKKWSKRRNTFPANEGIEPIKHAAQEQEFFIPALQRTIFR
jgi:hypothetical protein